MGAVAQREAYERLREHYVAGGCMLPCPLSKQDRGKRKNGEGRVSGGQRGRPLPSLLPSHPKLCSGNLLPMPLTCSPAHRCPAGAAALPYWLERRVNATVEAAQAGVAAAQQAVAGGAAAAAAAAGRVWAERVEPVLASTWRSTTVTANRAAAQLKGWWLHSGLPVVRGAEAVLERHLGEGWPRLKSAASEAASAAVGGAKAGWEAAMGGAQRCWEAAAHTAIAWRAHAEAAVAAQLSRVPALAPLAQKPALPYILLALLAAPLALLLLLAAAAPKRAGGGGRPGGAEEPGRRRFVSRSDTVAAGGAGGKGEKAPARKAGEKTAIHSAAGEADSEKIADGKEASDTAES